MPGNFITFEGGEGAGKTTQITRLKTYLETKGLDVVASREPGGTPQGEKVRNLLVNGAVDSWSAAAEALLNYAARDAHLRQVIWPALARGAHVICDRFMDSTRAYQGYAGGCDLGLIDALEKAIVASTRPKLTIILDLEPETGLARARARGSGAEDRYERKGLQFHRQIREAFHRIAKAEPARCRLIDASKPLDEVALAVQHAYNEVIGVT